MWGPLGLDRREDEVPDPLAAHTVGNGAHSGLPLAEGSPAPRPRSCRPMPWVSPEKTALEGGAGTCPRASRWEGAAQSTVGSWERERAWAREGEGGFPTSFWKSRAHILCFGGPNRAGVSRDGQGSPGPEAGVC